jgi:hypothetical protein
MSDYNVVIMRGTGQGVSAGIVIDFVTDPWRVKDSNGVYFDIQACFMINE